MQRTIPVIICMDVEPDVRELDLRARADWKGFEESLPFIEALRARPRSSARARNFSWFVRMDPQVETVYGTAGWAATKYAEAFARLHTAGDEIGLHTHAWRWDAQRRRWVVDQGDAEWVGHCLRTSFRAYEEAFGRACDSFRFGDRWMSDEALAFVERMGVRFDLTVEPGRPGHQFEPHDEIHTGTTPDYT